MNEKRPIYLVNQGTPPDMPMDPLPLGVLYVGKSLEKAGYRVKIFHLRGKEDKRLMDAVDEESPLFVGFSNFVSERLKYDIELSKTLHGQGIKVVWGGIFSTALPEVPLRSGCVDYVVTGEGELSAPLLAEAIDNGELPKGVPGAGYLDNGEFVLEPPQAPRDDLDQFELGLHLIDIEDYIYRDPSGDLNYIAIPYSRGCPHKCAFCYNSMSETRQVWRAHSAEYMRELVDRLKRNHGVNHVAISSDNAFGKVKEAMATIGGMGIRWGSAAHINSVTPEFANWAAESGCFRMGFGIESASPRVLEIMQKRFDPAIVPERLELLHKRGVYTISNWVGLVPGEEEDDLRMTLDMMEDLWQRFPRHGEFFNVFRPYPHTRLFEDAVELGFDPPRNLEQWSKANLEIHRLLGWSDKRARRFEKLIHSLYGKDRASARRTWGPWVRVRPYLTARARRLAMRGPVEEFMVMAREGRKQARKILRKSRD